MIAIYSEFSLGKLHARYLRDDTGAIELQLLPADGAPLPEQRRHADSMVQAYLTGDELPGGYSGGRTLRNSGTVRALRLESQHLLQDASGCCIETVLSHPKGVFTHRLRWQTGSGCVAVETRFSNRSDRPVTLEYLSSFSLGGRFGQAEAMPCNGWFP